MGPKHGWVGIHHHIGEKNMHEQRTPWDRSDHRHWSCSSFLASVASIAEGRSCDQNHPSSTDVKVTGEEMLPLMTRDVSFSHPQVRSSEGDIFQKGKRTDAPMSLGDAFQA
jgi:hypothetical protein